QLADAKGQFEEAAINANSQRALDAAGATTKLNLQSAVNREDQARRGVDLLQAQLERYPMTLEAENRQAQAKIDRASRKVERLRERVSELEVRAGFAGVIQKIDIEEGKRLG